MDGETDNPPCPPDHDPDAWARGYGIQREPETEREALAREARQEAMLDAAPILAEHRRLQGE